MEVHPGPVTLKGREEEYKLSDYSLNNRMPPIENLLHWSFQEEAGGGGLGRVNPAFVEVDGLWRPFQL